MSPEFLYIVNERAPTGSAGTKVYVSLPFVYLHSVSQRTPHAQRRQRTD